MYRLNLLVPYHSDPMRTHGSNTLLASILLPEVLEFGRSPAAIDGNVCTTWAVRFTVRKNPREPQ